MYRVESDRSVVVDGLGVLEPGEPKVFTRTEAEGFKLVRGVPLLQTNVPDGVTVTIIIKEN
jgi:hypothetical protein